MIENQLDLSMKKVFLGFSDTETLYASGCLVHCIARILNLPRLEVHDQLKAKGCFFNECLLDLTKVPTAYPQLTYKGKFTYDNDLALKTIKEQGIVIAEVDYNPIMNGTQQHFVCMVGGGNIEDPLGGKIKPVSTYKTYLTLRVFEIKELPVEENMTNEEKILLDFIRANKITEGMLRQGQGYITDNIDKKVQDLEDANFKLQQTLSDLKESLVNEKKSSSGWHSALNTANLEIKSLNQQLLSATDKLTVNQLFKLIVKKLQNK